MAAATSERVPLPLLARLPKQSRSKGKRWRRLKVRYRRWGVVCPRLRKGTRQATSSGGSPSTRPGLAVKGSASLGAECAVGRVPGQVRVSLNAMQQLSFVRVG